MDISEATKKRFWGKVEINEKAECWFWKAGLSRRNYGWFFFNKKKGQAHRFSFFLKEGYFPPMVCRTCDRPSCVNPHHLFAGDSKINTRDRDLKGKNPCKVGEKNQNAKLSISKIKEIRDLSLKGNTQRLLAKRYGVAQKTISNIISRKTWKHV